MLRNVMRAAALCAALCALGALTASSAFAGQFTTNGVSTVTFTGSQGTEQNIFEITNSAGSFVKVKCSEASFEGTSSTPSPTEVTITPTYGGCTLGGLAASVTMDGCQYTLTGESSPAGTFSVDIVSCTAGKAITIKKGNCTVTVPAQNNLSHVVFDSSGSASEMDIVATATVSVPSGGINNTQTGSECPAPGLTSSDASYSGSVTIRAFSDEGNRSVSKHEHSYSEVICGSLLSLTVS
jgi:hypothetical protein